MRLGRRKDAEPAADPDRRALIELCLYAYDRAASPAVAERIATGLQDLGVRAVRPDGEAFDPGRHEAGGTAPTTDPERHDTVAETEVPGFSDGDEVIRVPVVTVYRLQPDAEPAE